MKKILALLGAEHVPVGHAEKLISAAGGLVALLLVGSFNTVWTGSIESALLMTSVGASIVLLFGVPHGALAQPWPVFGGHLISAAIGVGVAMWVSDVLLAGGLAVGGAIAAMYYLRCVHPPGGATALVAVSATLGPNSTGFAFLLEPVLLNVAVLLAAAFVINYPFAWRRYPAYLSRRAQATAAASPVSVEDIRYALDTAESFVDVTEEDLAELFRVAAEHAGEVGTVQGSRMRCVERGIGCAPFPQGLNHGATQPTVLYKVIPLGRRENGEDLFAWSKYTLAMEPDESTEPAAG